MSSNSSVKECQATLVTADEKDNFTVQIQSKYTRESAKKESSDDQEETVKVKTIMFTAGDIKNHGEISSVSVRFENASAIFLITSVNVVSRKLDLEHVLISSSRCDSIFKIPENNLHVKIHN